MRKQPVETIEHFLKLARRGKPHTGASGGELRARRLAIAILENAVGLDAQAIEGAAQFLLRAPLSISTARALIDADAEH